MTANSLHISSARFSLSFASSLLAFSLLALIVSYLLQDSCRVGKKAFVGC